MKYENIFIVLKITSIVPFLNIMIILKIRISHVNVKPYVKTDIFTLIYCFNWNIMKEDVPT